MATIGELLRSLDHDEVVAAIDQLYPQLSITTLEEFRRVCLSLLALNPCSTTLSCEIVIRESVEDDAHYDVVVFGRDANGENVAIEYTPWPEWLAMDVVVKSEIGDQPLVNIMAHILWEMTWAGFDNDSIQMKLQKLKDIAVSVCV